MVKRVRGSTTGRPIMALLDLLGRRWVLRIVWELGEGRSVFILEDAERATYSSGARKAIYRDADGNEVGFAGVPS